MLHYFRCLDCLSTVTYDAPRLDARCICGGKFEYIGQVTDERVYSSQVVPACDDRCTSAQGPKCICQCGGKNHGSHRTVEIKHDQGEAIVKPADDKAIQRGQEYRAARQQIIEAIHGLPHYEDYNRRRIDRDAWDKIHYSLDDLHKASLARTHKSRMEKLARLHRSLMIG